MIEINLLSKKLAIAVSACAYAAIIFSRAAWSGPKNRGACVASLR